MKLRAIRKTKAGKTAIPVWVKRVTFKWAYRPDSSRLLRIPVARPVRVLLVDEADAFYEPLDHQTGGLFSLMQLRGVRTFAATKGTTQ